MRSAFLSHCIHVMIAGKMTPVLQLTDTDVVAVMKRAAEREERCILQERRDRAEANGELRASTKCTKVEMLRIAW